VRPLTLGIVGAGRIAQTYAQVLAGCASVEVAAVADPDPVAASALGSKLSCPTVGSHGELFERGELEAVLICAPPVTHAEISVFFLERGVHVMCEKPLAITVDEALHMLEVARTNQTILTMASKFRYLSDVIRARSIVDSGILGEIILMENTFASRVDMTGRWNSKPAVAGGGVLIDNGTHSVDVARYVLGPIDEVMAVEGRRVQGFEVEDTAQLFLRSREGVRATVDLSWSIDKERDSYLDIYGSNGTVQVGWRRSRFRQSTSPEWVEFGTGYDKVQAITDQLTNFAAAIRGEERLRITAIDALASVEVIAAAYASLGDDDWIKVESHQPMTVSG
jgi:predicted dehydrogenase